MVVFDADPAYAGVSRQYLARAALQRIQEAVIDYRHDREPRLLVRHGQLAAGATLALIVGLWIARVVVRKSRSALERRYKEKVHGIQIQSFRLIEACLLYTSPSPRDGL